MKAIVIMLTVLFACSTNAGLVDNDTPLMVVIKLQSAEAQLNFDIAKKYVNVEKVYNDFPGELDAEEKWKEIQKFYSTIGKSKKFTNQIAYFKYRIDETIKNNTATVTFTALNEKAMVKEIVYTLEREEKWMVVGIKYVN